MDEPKEPPRSVKVVDRRKFTADGNLREDLPPTNGEPTQARPDETQRPGDGPGEQSPGTSPAQPRSERAPSEPPRAARPEQPTSRPASPPDENGMPSASQHFLELVTMVAQNAEILIVGAEGMPARPQDARRMIDWLSALEEKTAGNLSSEESELLRGVIFQLRALYVQSQR